MSTETLPEASPDITAALPAYELQRGLREMLRFADTVTYHPTISGVWLGWDGKQLTATATDRYVYGRVIFRGASVTGGAPWEALLSEESVRLVTRALADRVGAVQVTKLGDRLTVAGPDITLTVPLDLTAQYPFRLVLGSPPEPKPTTQVAVDMRILRPFLKLDQSPADPARITLTGSHGVIRVAVGDWFTGGIMPVKLQGFGDEPEGGAA